MFETGSVFLGETAEGLPHEEEHVAAVMTGKWLDHSWQGEPTCGWPRPADAPS